MFVCPITGCRLEKAKIKGGMLWYSPESDGRLMTLATVKHYLGEHDANEIWMRSTNAPEGQYNCPGCQNKMREVLEPQWVGKFHVDVCRQCWLVWMDHGEHPNIPHGSDISAEVEKLKQAAAYTEVSAHQHEDRKPTAEPDSIIHRLPGFIYLPVKTWVRGFPYKTVVLMILSVILYSFYNGPTLFEKVYLGIHLYFFYLFGSDLEFEISHLEYLLFFILSAIIPYGITHVYGSDYAHFSLWPMIIAQIALAIILPLQAKFSYMVPAVHYLNLPNIDYWKRLRGFRWVHMPQWMVAVMYILIIAPAVYRYIENIPAFPVKVMIFAEISLGLLYGAILKSPYGNWFSNASK